MSSDRHADYVRHVGSRAEYQRGCHCAACTEANTRYCYRYRVDTGRIPHPKRPGRPKRHNDGDPHG